MKGSSASCAAAAAAAGLSTTRMVGGRSSRTISKSMRRLRSSAYGGRAGAPVCASGNSERAAVPQRCATPPACPPAAACPPLHAPRCLPPARTRVVLYALVDGGQHAVADFHGGHAEVGVGPTAAQADNNVGASVQRAALLQQRAQARHRRRVRVAALLLALCGSTGASGLGGGAAPASSSGLAGQHPSSTSPAACPRSPPGTCDSSGRCSVPSPTTRCASSVGGPDSHTVMPPCMRPQFSARVGMPPPVATTQFLKGDSS